MKYFCPVCGYDALAAPPADYNICPCCGTEFGYDDANRTWAELRESWLKTGARWFSSYTAAPAGWDALRQVAKLAEQHVRADSTFTLTRPVIGPVPAEVITAGELPIRVVETTDQESPT